MRVLVVFFRLFPFVVAFLRDRHRWILLGRPAKRTVAEHQRRAERLVRAVAALGPTYIKLAQVFASRADVVPEPYLSVVGTLTDRVPPLEPGTAETVIREELEQDVGAVFEQFDSTPLAAASLGQVHRARWQGRDVVVKILRPGVEEMVHDDLDIAFRVLMVLNLLAPSHQSRAVSAVVEEFARRIDDEMDFREEAKSAEAVRRNLASESGVVVPEVITSLVRRRVLVLEYIEGTRIDRLQERIASGELDLDRLLRTIVDVYLKMALEDGLLHADPHSGNLLVDERGRLVLLDFGMTVRIEPETRSRLIRTVAAAARGDVDGVITGFYALGILDPEVDRGTIRDAAERLMALSLVDAVTPRQVQRFVEQVLQTFYEFPLMLPPNFVYVGRAAVLVEGIGHRYDPNFNMVRIARPAATKFVARLVEGALGRDPSAKVQDWTQEGLGVVRSLRDLLRRLEREELRVRTHPRDAIELQRFVKTQVRRGLLATFAFTTALISTLVWMRTDRFEILATGLTFSLGMFVTIYIMPSHLFQNPLRFRRRRLR
jgi:predicted unusual protein kinase regulating ubiquinone biosynthesis (AarF/ABC1/UbiB family)